MLLLHASHASGSCDFESELFFMQADTATVRSCTEDAGILINDLGTPLHWAVVLAKRPEVVSALLDAGANVHSQDASGATPLHLAAYYSRFPEVIAALLANGADVNSASMVGGTTPLHLAAANRSSLEVLVLLLESGADVGVIGEHAIGAPIHAAAQADNSAGITILLEYGAYVDERNGFGWTPLHGAVMEGSLDAIVKLVAAGADINSQDYGGASPLHFAVQTEAGLASQVSAILLDAGADPELADREGKTPGDLVMANQKLQGTDIYKMMLERICPRQAEAVKVDKFRVCNVPLK